MIAILLAMALADQPKCYRANDIKGAVCWALCRRDGADNGIYMLKTGKCVCGFEKDYKEFTDSVIYLPRKSTD